MFEDFRLGQYVQVDSILHSIDPRAKLWGFTVLTILVFIPDQRSVLAWLLAALLLFISRVPVHYYLSSIKALWPVMLFTIVLNTISFHSGLFMKIGPFVLSRPGLLNGILMTVRLIGVVLLTSLFTFTTPPLALTDGMEKLLKPLRKIGVPAHEIALMMSIAIRFIPTIMEEGDKLVKALQARGGEFGAGGPLKRAKSYLPILIPLFIGSFRRADELALAMEVRCYHGGDGRTRMHELKFSRQDYVIMAGLTLLLVTVLWVI